MKQKSSKKNLSAFMRFYAFAIKDDKVFQLEFNFFYGLLSVCHKVS